MRKYGRSDRIKLTVLLAMSMVLAVVLSGSVRSSAGRGEVRPDATKDAIGPLSDLQPVQGKSAAPPATASPKLEGCLGCHGKIEPMHKPTAGNALKDDKDGQGLTCTSCHGGNPAATTKETAHVEPRFPREWRPNTNPMRTNTLLLKESPEFVRFINPGDNRVAQLSCGSSSTSCHSTEASQVATSMMTHGAMLWGAALYNNGGYPIKDSRFGESYAPDTGAPQELIQTPPPTPAQIRFKGILSFLDPLPRWEIAQPGNILRVFERGGERRLEVGLPDKEELPGRPDKGLSPRGLGTLQRTDPVYLGIQKTRLLDPTLNLLGTNDHPGDYRSSGCTACHVIYANDRDPVHSSFYSKAGNLGMSQSADDKVKKNETGHPIKHQFTKQIPTSQCMVCHMHPGTNMETTYLGMTWWDNETDGDKMYPRVQHNPSQSEEQQKLNSNPESASLRGNWSDPAFLAETGSPEFNRRMTRTQFADFHGHGWIYRAVFKKDKKGAFIDKDGVVIDQKNVDANVLGEAVAFTDADNSALKNDTRKTGVPVHLKDIHLEKGMHCADCHFRQDEHGDGNLYNEPRAAIEISCIDCHGSIKSRATLVSSGPAAAKSSANVRVGGKNVRKDFSGRYLRRIQSADGSSLFQIADDAPITKKDSVTGKSVVFPKGSGAVIQNSLVEPGKWWRVKQTIDTITPGSPDYSEKSRYAKTIRTDNETWGDVPSDESKLAHRDAQMTCFACHSAWMTSCFGCHLSMQANRKMPNRHNEGDNSRNYTNYNFQVLRDDVFMLGREGTASSPKNADGTVVTHRIAPVRSSSAVIVSSQNQNREWIYSQQQTVSAEGYSGQSFNTHVPHTVRATETKGCSDCHVSKSNDNNAWMAQLLLQGTNFVNFMGRYVYVAAKDSLEAVVVTEHTDPQAVYGSTLQRLAYPANFKKFEERGRKLKEAYEHAGNPEVLQVQLRGEYAYVAAGEGGLRVYDVAQIDQKGFSERISKAPVSPFGQKFYVKTKFATAVASPSTLAVDPARWRLTVEGKMVPPEQAARMKEKMLNEEQPIHPLYAYLYVADKYEGLILVNAATLLDGDPLNNYLKRDLTFNPEGALDGANNIAIAGTHAYVTTDRGLVIIDIDDPLHPRIVGKFGPPVLNHPRAVAVQFRYCFVVDEDGLKVIDVTAPERPRFVDGAQVRLTNAQDVYVARTYAYVANGKEGVAIIDVGQPEHPRLDQTFNAGGAINDSRQVKVAMTNASLFAYVADGRNGLRVLQMTSPETMPDYAGFSPRPQPVLIATYKTKGEALAVSKGLDRDRAADESGNQVAVFGRRGARPFTLDEMQRMFLDHDGKGSFFSVTDAPTTKPLDFKPGLASSVDGGTPAEADTISLNKNVSSNPRVKSTALIGGFSLFGLAIGWKWLYRTRRRPG